ncbi:MAG TPA: hypothetical protein VGX48_12385 [Pyrinomonadaceae bacterium]|jgi:hypothetical protein|nr:hypothetical protein [Pyrinomonadaceae bacterium]
MRPRHYALLIGLALFAGFAGRAVSERLLAPQVAEAKQDDGRDEWEYCAVTKAQYAGSPQAGVFWIAYFRPNGVEVAEVKAGPMESAQGKAISKLGSEGWVMVGQGPLEVRQFGPQGTPTALYFRRARRN